jgi:hypothetical protein
MCLMLSVLSYSTHGIGKVFSYIVKFIPIGSLCFDL